VAEHFLHANHPSVSRQENGLDSDVVGANSGANPNSARYGGGRFRPLFAGAQSTPLQKLANPMTSQ
jgi:hypothetical protein